MQQVDETNGSTRDAWVRRRAPGPWVTRGLVALCLVASFGSAARAQDEATARKMSRQIGVLEKIFDQVLVDSPNFLVPGRNNTRGIYLEEFGALLTFEASLVDKDHLDFDFEWPRDYRIEENEKGDKVIVIPKVGSDDEDERPQGRSSPARLYERGKVELRSALLDYADTLTGLGDGEWVALAAYLKDSDYFLDERISRLVIKVRMRDVRAYNAEKIDEKTVLARFVEDEY